MNRVTIKDVESYYDANAEIFGKMHLRAEAGIYWLAWIDGNNTAIPGGKASELLEAMRNFRAGYLYAKGIK